MTKILAYKIPSDTRSKAQIKALLDQIDVIIAELFTTALKSAMSGIHSEYELDTGQTRTKVKYASVASVQQSINDFESLRQMYQQKYLGNGPGVVRLMDEKNFRRC